VFRRGHPSKPGHTATAEEIRIHCEAQIAAFKTPACWEFVAALPLSPAGRAFEHELRKPNWEGMDRQVH
jgi:fatty-acyl-CoA synthase